MFHSKITRRLVTSFLLIVLVSLSLLGILLLNYFRDYTMQQEKNALILNAKIIETSLEDQLYSRDVSGLHTTLQELHEKTDLRVTVIDADGAVLGDTADPNQAMNNHLDREEVQQAMTEPYGLAIRQSETLNENLMYVAVPVYRGGQLIGIIRTSSSLVSMEQSYHTSLRVILSALFFALLAALIIAIWLAHRQVQPIRCLSLDAMEIASGNLHKRLQWQSGDEFDTLVQTINQLTRNLSAKIQESQAEAEKMSLILNHTDNAIMLIDERGLIVDTNRQAEEDFQLQGNALHRHSIHVIGSAELSETAQEVCRQGKAQTITLTSISGFAETLLDDDFKDPEASRHFIAIIYREAQRMNRLMKGLLELARLDSTHGQTNVKRRPVAINKLLHQTAEQLQQKASAKKQPLREEPSPTPLYVLAAPELFSQILYNLTENAIKYTPEGGTIHIKARQEGDRATITVTDNGIGIAPTDLPRIFDRFYRVDKARARKSGGNGIGLSLVKFLVELFDGTIDVKSQIGQGTTFTLTFPLTTKS